MEQLNGYIEIQGLEETLERFNSLLTTNPKMEKQLKEIIRKVLKDAAKDTRLDAKKMLGNRDPRQAYRAVKHVVYKSIFGGNINIVSPRRRSGSAASLPPSRSGRVRSSRTRQIMQYWGRDRAFILRFLNNGTKGREVKTMNDSRIKRTTRPQWKNPRTPQRTYKGRIGNRGELDAQNWFQSSSVRNLEKSAGVICDLIEDAIDEMWEGNSANS